MMRGRDRGGLFIGVIGVIGAMTGAAVAVALVGGRAAAGPGGAATDEIWVLNDAHARATHDCAKQPVVAINGSDDDVTLTGACTSVAVNGGSIRLAIASAQALAVNGAASTVTVDAVGAISATGASNTVTWKSALTGKRPKVSDTGAGNKIVQAPAAPAAPAPAPAAPAAPATPAK